jgi:hypothetical protein
VLQVNNAIVFPTQTLNGVQLGPVFFTCGPDDLITFSHQRADLTFGLYESIKEDKVTPLSAIRNNESTANAERVDMKLEVVLIPVSKVNRAKEFYTRLGWRLDGDFTAGNDWRGVQFTPPGSGCSVIFGKNVTTAAPGSAQDLYLAVSDI